MTDADALAIKALSVQPAAGARGYPRQYADVPFNQRWSMVFWSALFNPDRRFEPDTARARNGTGAAYLAEAMAHCGECHTPRNLAFALDKPQEIRRRGGGGLARLQHLLGQTTGVGAWRDEDLVSYLSIGHADGHGHRFGTDGRGGRSQLELFGAADIRAVVAYLRAVPPTPSPDLPATVGAAKPRHRTRMAAAHRTRAKNGVRRRLRQLPRLDRRESASPPFATLHRHMGGQRSQRDQCRQIVIPAPGGMCRRVRSRCRPSAIPIPTPRSRRSPIT